MLLRPKSPSPELLLPFLKSSLDSLGVLFDSFVSDSGGEEVGEVKALSDRLHLCFSLPQPSVRLAFQELHFE